MRTLLRISSLLFAALLLIGTSAAQSADKKAAPKPPDSQSKVLLDSWNDIGRKLIAMAEDMPEDKYDFKPTPPSAPLPNSSCTPPEPTTSSSIPPREKKPPKAIPSATNSKPRLPSSIT